MNIWLLTIGEPIPIAEGVRDRLHRTGCFGRYLASRGHHVVWWTSTFDHFRKKHLMPHDASITDPSGLKIRLLHGRGYRRNVSVSRFLDHAQVARRFSALSTDEPKPDILISALPTVEMCLAAEAYGARYGVPAVVDLRDMWPDIIADAAPAPLRPFSRVLLSPLFSQAHRACASASALIGITDVFVDWGLRKARRARSWLDRAFPFTYDPEISEPEEIQAAETFWDDRGIHANSSELLVCYFGNVGRQIDLFHVLEAARRLLAAGKSVRFILCGEGERLEDYRRDAADLPNVLFPGWVNRAQILTLMRRSSLGLDPLKERFDFLATVNNKAIEYMSAGLPVISSPQQGTLCAILKNAQCGVSYPSGDAVCLSEHLSRFAENREQLRLMGANALSLFRKEFSAEIVYPAMENHLAIIQAQYRQGEKAVSAIPYQG